eukprot:GHVU01226044.1.p1 GENE.GHVU01226044.1~~GHVU01226044.1.p1  ORF type:complete len:293 (+),score=33.20 GHVU01226044.1:111-881(+)
MRTKQTARKSVRPGGRPGQSHIMGIMGKRQRPSEQALPNKAVATGATKGRLLKMIEAAVPGLLSESSVSDLEEMQRDLKRIVDVKSRETPKERVSTRIKALDKRYNKIEDSTGDHWKSEKTSDAVGMLDELELEPISNSILALDNVDERWEAAVEFTEETAGMIQSASETFEKLVNGSCGEWCPDSARIVERLWEELMKGGMPSDKGLVKQAAKAVEGLGDYRRIDPREFTKFLSSKGEASGTEEATGTAPAQEAE